MYWEYLFGFYFILRTLILGVYHSFGFSTMSLLTSFTAVGSWQLEVRGYTVGIGLISFLLAPVPNYLFHNEPCVSLLKATFHYSFCESSLWYVVIDNSSIMGQSTHERWTSLKWSTPEICVFAAAKIIGNRANSSLWKAATMDSGSAQTPWSFVYRQSAFVGKRLQFDVLLYSPAMPMLRSRSIPETEYPMFSSLR